MACECGCGYEGPDEVTDWLVMEASFAALDRRDEEIEAEAIESIQAEQEQAATMTRLHAMALRAIGR